MSSTQANHLRQLERLSSDFFADRDGLRAVAQRTAAVDEVVRALYAEVFGGEDDGMAAVAVGGYGRRELFPHSDVDLLLLFRRNRDVHWHKDRIATLLARLWDSKLRVSHSVRDPGDCTRLAPDNTELHISLLDTRFVAGDAELVEQLRTTTLPKFYLREQRHLLRSLTEAAHRRHQAHGRTLYHLEPDVKEGPGGLRDYQLACWVAQLENALPGRLPASEEYLPRPRDWDIAEAKRFLFALRCYLHYYHRRDKNQITFEMQDRIAAEGAGKVYPAPADPARLMRVFFRNARAIHRLALRLIDESSTPTNALLTILRGRKSRLSNRDFTVVQGRVYFRSALALDASPELALLIFVFQARHGLPLAAQAELRVREHLPSLRAHFTASRSPWRQLREILLLPHTYQALESMRETGVLYVLFPEFELVDCLVIRDFHHRYTVDEHTLVTIRVLKELPAATEPLDRRFANLLGEVQRPELLYLALLLHDLGKGVEQRLHDEAGAELARNAMRRIGLPDGLEADMVLALVRDHLAMSQTMTKRDIGDAGVLESFKAQVLTLERLKLLTLLTYADTVGVNPSARTAWRKELLWRLYLGVYGRFQRDHEDERIRADAEADCLRLASSEAERQRMRGFLRGFPERYLRTNESDQVYRHFVMAGGLQPGAAAVSVARAEAHYEIVVVAADRPGLFASLCAGVASFGLNIQHAEAFSNTDGLALDSFHATSRVGGDFDDGQIKCLRKRLRRAAEGSLDPDELVRKQHPVARPRHAMRPPEVSFDNATSENATIFYVGAADRHGLLYDLAIVISRFHSEIDVVLSETQGHRALDVFYLRKNHRKLDEAACHALRTELLKACEPRQTEAALRS